MFKIKKFLFSKKANLLLSGIVLALTLLVGPRFAPILATSISLLAVKEISASAVTREEGFNRTLQVSNLRNEMEEDISRQFYLLWVKDVTVVDSVCSYAEDVDKDLLFALIWNESNFKEYATNLNRNKETLEVWSTDRGLFQLNDKSYPNLAPHDFFDVNTNVQLGVNHIRGALKDNNGDLRKALYAYNAGQSRVTTPPESTKIYAAKIIKLRLEIKAKRQTYVKDTLALLVKKASLVTP